MNTFHHLKLGRQPARLDPRTLKLANYIKALPPPPASMGYVDKLTKLGLMLNDSIGDCTVAAAGHAIQQWTTYASTPVIPSDGDILRAYMAVSGYNPNDPSSDQGAVVLDVLKYWRRTGIAGHRIMAFVSVDPANREEIKQAVTLFGNCYIGVDLPISAQTAPIGGNRNPVWQVPKTALSGDGEPGSWGGHAIPIVGFGPDGTPREGTEVITWGQVFDMTWNFIEAYVSEAWVTVSTDWISRDGVSPSGFALSELLNDISQIK